MAIPLRQTLTVGAHVMRNRLRGNDKYALVLELEPLYQCNLACQGCGKIQQPRDILQRRLSVEECVRAVEECDAPIVSIAGGEPLLHKEIHLIVEALLERRRYVYLCTNALWMERRMDQFSPHPCFAWMVHVDGMGERHDQSVDRPGTFDVAVRAIGEAQRRGFRVNTNTTFFNTDDARSIREVLDFLNDEVGVDDMQISPGFAYETAPDQDGFLGVERTRQIFRDAFAGGRRRRWRLSHSPVFLDFLEGRVDMECTAWGIPSFSVLGWQRPCYLMGDEHVGSWRELVEETDWSLYGRGRDPRCANCMAHCGYEPTAVRRTLDSPRQSVRALADTVRAQVVRRRRAPAGR